MRVILPPNRLTARYTRTRTRENDKNAQEPMRSWAFFYWVDMLIANTLRHTAMVSGAGSYVCVMVEHRGFEPLTPTLPVLCAPNCANAPSFGILSDICHPVKSLERKNIKNITFIFRQVAAKRAARRRPERKIGKNTHFPRWGFMLFRPCPSCMMKEKRRGLRWRFCG